MTSRVEALNAIRESLVSQIKKCETEIAKISVVNTMTETVMNLMKEKAGDAPEMENHNETLQMTSDLGKMRLRHEQERLAFHSEWLNKINSWNF